MRKTETRTFEQYADAGVAHDVMSALILLTKAYISQCGVSIGYRTVVYYAAERWREKLAWLSLPLSEIARKEPLVKLMPLITPDYIAEYYDEYDITGLSNEELKEYCNEIVQQHEIDEPTIEVLCWGINDYMSISDENLNIQIETVADDGTILKGTILEQNCSETSIELNTCHNLYAAVPELMVDARELLIAAYNDYKRLMQSRVQAEKLYEEYKIALCQSDEISHWEISKIFDSIFKNLLPDSVISLKSALTDMFGMEFYSLYKQEYPSWYQKQ